MNLKGAQYFTGYINVTKVLFFLHETHSSIQTEKMWRSEWGSKVLFSHGTSNSRGVAILFPNNIEYTIKKTISDTEGRFLIVEVEIEETVFILCNVYAPTKDHMDEQLNFLTKFREECLQYLDGNIIIGGDFNAILNPKLDKRGGRSDTRTDYVNNLTNFIEEFDLIDIWYYKENYKLSELLC